MTKPVQKIAFYLLGLILVASCASVKNTTVLRPSCMVAGADYVGNETCAFCHEEVVRDFRKAEHASFIVSLPDDTEIGGCEACHGAGSLHVEGGGDEEHIINPAKKPEVCFQCHSGIKSQFNLQYRHPLLEGRMNCVDCHSPHGEEIDNPKGIFVARENETCRQCHRDKTRPFVFEHEAMREGCTVCHRPHGSINNKMLVENDLNLCLKCHGQIATQGSVLIGSASHTSRVAEGGCWAAGCHTAVHGSNINPHLRY